MPRASAGDDQAERAAGAGNRREGGEGEDERQRVLRRENRGRGWQALVTQGVAGWEGARVEGEEGEEGQELAEWRNTVLTRDERGADESRSGELTADPLSPSASGRTRALHRGLR